MHKCSWWKGGHCYHDSCIVMQMPIKVMRADCKGPLVPTNVIESTCCKCAKVQLWSWPHKVTLLWT